MSTITVKDGTTIYTKTGAKFLSSRFRTAGRRVLIQNRLSNHGRRFAPIRVGTSIGACLHVSGRPTGLPRFVLGSGLKHAYARCTSEPFALDGWVDVEVEC